MIDTETFVNYCWLLFGVCGPLLALMAPSAVKRLVAPVRSCMASRARVVEPLKAATAEEEEREEAASRRELATEAVVVDLRYFVYIAMFFPVFGGLFAITMSLTYNFEAATYSHCHVANVVPSISASIGIAPQRWTWMICIALQVYWSILNSLICFAVRRGRIARRVAPADAAAAARLLAANRLALYASFMENLALLLLTMVPSSERYPVHELGFLMWYFGALAKMLLVVYAHAQLPASASVVQARHEALASTWRRRTLACNVGAMLLAVPAYALHMARCVPYAYSVFSGLEWFVVGTNIAFNAVDFVHNLPVDADGRFDGVVYVGSARFIATTEVTQKVL